MSEPGTDEWLAAVERSRIEDTSETGWWYLSFADPNRPTGTQFLGGLYIDAPSLPDALTKSHLLGLNPGGEVMFVEMPMEFFENVPEDMRLRLLSREELEGPASPAPASPS